MRTTYTKLNLYHICSACFYLWFYVCPLLSLVDDIPELLSSSSLFSMLLPLILAYIGPVAASVPKVSGQTRR